MQIQLQTKMTKQHKPKQEPQLASVDPAAVAVGGHRSAKQHSKSRQVIQGGRGMLLHSRFVFRFPKPALYSIEVENLR